MADHARAVALHAARLARAKEAVALVRNARHVSVLRRAVKLKLDARGA